MLNNKCCFSGHRFFTYSPEMRNKLKFEVECLILTGVDYFICGGAYGFDMLAGEIVLGFRQIYNIQLELALPCHEQARGWAQANKIRYDYLLNNADSVNYISDEYYDGCMQKRNRYMVDNSDYCIAYLTQMRGGTYYTVKYALNQGKKVINVASDNLFI